MLDHRPIIVIVYVYNMDRKISVSNPDRSEWVPTSLCENPRRSSLKESVPNFSYFIFVLDVIFVL